MSETIPSSEGQQNNGSPWSEENMKDAPEFAGEKKFIKLEEIANLCGFDNMMIYGHGTASARGTHMRENSGLSWRGSRD